MSNRREFFAAATGALAVTGLGMPALAADSPDVARRLGGSPTQALFAGLQGQDFTVHLGAGRRSTLRLLAVKPRTGTQRVEQFSLVLGGKGKRALDGGIYQLEHAHTGRFQLRLDPSGGHAVDPVYRADLSLLV